MKQEKEATTGTKISPEEIKRVKGLGCLKDKRYDDIFNIRVITRNGRIQRWSLGGEGGLFLKNPLFILYLNYGARKSVRI